MGGRNCCVQKCRRRSHDHRGRKIPNGLTFHCFPAWRTNEGSQISELTKRRRAAWVAAVGRSNITFNHIPTSMRVCSRHFHSGKPVYEMLESDPDWVPSLQLGHSEGSSRRTECLLLSKQPERHQKQRWTAETGPSHESRSPQRESEDGPARPAVRPWRDVKSLLLSVLQRQSNISEQPADETQEQPPAVKKMDLSFRDFFRDALDASLEASSRSRTLSARRSSSCCLNCVRLQRTIVELQEKLSRLTGGQEDINNKAPLPPDRDLQSPETVLREKEEPAWMEPLSPAQMLLLEGDQDVDSADESTPTDPAGPQDNSSKRPKLRRPPRFNAAWLKMFWFLRYSQTLDQMWCHVCRLHADVSHQNLALIKGSRMFKVHNIKKHSSSKYHKDNVERHMLDMRELKH